MDEVSIYNRELSEDEVKKNYDIKNSSSLNWKYYFENKLREFVKELIMSKQGHKDIHKKHGLSVQMGIIFRVSATMFI